MRGKKAYVVALTNPTKEEVQALFAEGYKKEEVPKIYNKSGVPRVGNRPRKPRIHYIDK